jgi:hypothetical protein
LIRWLLIMHLFDHADREAFLEAAELAAIATSLVDRTTPIGQADILGAFLYCSLKESFAAFASADAVVLTGGIVAANGAQLRRRFRSRRR